MLKNIFPQFSQIPNEWQLIEFIEQREYLVNGELRIWGGPMNEVVSPVSINTVINIIVIPNSNIAKAPFDFFSVLEIIWHITLVGLPIAVLTKRHFSKI